MKLSEYLRAHNITSKSFAKKLGVSEDAVKKWRQRTRIPRPATATKIMKATKGRVDYAEWY